MALDSSITIRATCSLYSGAKDRRILDIYTLSSEKNPSGFPIRKILGPSVLLGDRLHVTLGVVGVMRDLLGAVALVHRGRPVERCAQIVESLSGAKPGTGFAHGLI